MILIPALMEAEEDKSLELKANKPNLHKKFLASLGYIWRFCCAPLPESGPGERGVLSISGEH